jgi:hypothetical protein
LRGIFQNQALLLTPLAKPRKADAILLYGNPTIAVGPGFYI